MFYLKKGARFMSTTMVGVFKNYDVYSCLPADSELLGKKKSFRMAVERLVDALNAYAENNSRKLVGILVDNLPGIGMYILILVHLPLVKKKHTSMYSNLAGIHFTVLN